MNGNDNLKMGLDRLNALFEWWGVPQNNGAASNVDGQMQRFQAFASDLQKAHGEAYSAQFDALVNASERVAGSLQKFAQCRQPQEAIALSSDVMSAILESASIQAKTWTQLAQKVQDCCTEMTSEVLAESKNGLGKPKKNGKA